jgi:molybdate/tungstate transport system substrate-binding protein
LKKTNLIVAAIAIIVLVPSTYFFVANYLYMNPSKTTVRVVCATSLLYPLEKVESSFEEVYPNIDIEIEGHGSIQVIRQITELGRSMDVAMVADYSLIPIMMYNTSIPNTNQHFANYYLLFAENSMVLAYTDNSRYAHQVNQSNWYSILNLSDTRLGFTNPELDALARAMSWKFR